MAETVKSRLRTHAYVFQPGEHVWVSTTFFDNAKVPLEARYSTIIGGDGRATGLIRNKMGASYMIDFDDGSAASVLQGHVNMIPKQSVATLRNVEEPVMNDDDDEYMPDMDDSSDDDNPDTNHPSSSRTDPPSQENTDPSQQNSNLPPLKQSEEVYLCHLGKDVLKGTFHDTDDKFVHGKELDVNHGRFFITKVLKDADRWKSFKPEFHCAGAAVMWKLANIRRLIRKPFSKLGTEATYATPLIGRKRKRNEGKWQVKEKKKALNSGEKYVWKKKNGEEKQYGRSRFVKGRCPQTCKQKCISITDDERVTIHKFFWSLASGTLQRGFIVKQVKQVPKARERKGIREKKKAKGKQKSKSNKKSNKENQPEAENSEETEQQDAEGSEENIDFAKQQEVERSKAGVGEAGGSEAGSNKAGGSEAGVGEAGVGEAGGSEAGGSEAGSSEAGGSEAGVGEAGGSEAGSNKAGGSEAGVGEAGGGEAGSNEAGGGEAGVSGSTKKERSREFTRKYTFTVDGREEQVCAKFFLNTLDIDEKRVRNALKSVSDTGTFTDSVRGLHEKHSTSHERELPIIEHISKFKTVESHYVRKSAKCQYLPMELTVREMHRMYVEEHDGIGKVENYNFYFKVFNEKFNLKFQKNKKDKCNQCEGFKNTPVELRTEDRIEKHDSHLDEKSNARDYKELKKKEGEKDNVITAAFDLEKVLLCPYGQTSSFYYSKRLKVHNFTVTDIVEMLSHCYVWHEGEAGKGSAEIGTCLQKFLRYVRSQDVDILNLFSDRCGGQNSNRMVIIAMHEMFLILKLETLGMNFLVTGHSQSENDNAHSLIEMKTKLRTLYTPAEWKTAIQMSFPHDKVFVSSLRSEDVVDFKNKNSFPEYASMLNDSTTENDERFSKKKDKKDGKVYWSKIMQYYFVKSDPGKLFFKYHYSAPDFKYTTIYNKVATRNMAVTKRAKLYEEPRGIERSKKEALLKLCKEDLIPRDKWKFFEDLSVTGDKNNEEDSATDSEDES